MCNLPPPTSLIPTHEPFRPLEYHNKTLTKLFNGNSQRACYGLAATIFGLGLLRDALLVSPSQLCSNRPQLSLYHQRYERAIRNQPFVNEFHHPYFAYTLIACGNVLVLSSYYSLGLTGTFLGDYFGILMDEKVEGFPFSITGAPMYWGSTMSFVGTAFLYGRPAGLVLSAVVFMVYWCALQFEEWVWSSKCQQGTS